MSRFMTRQRLESLAKYGGVTAAGFEWLAVVWFYVLQPTAFNGEHPISYFATLPQTRLIFSLCYCAAAVSFWLFTQYYLSRLYQVPTKLFTFSMVGFAAVATVPFDPNSGLSTAIHIGIAQIFSLTFIAGMFLTGHRNSDERLRQGSIGLAIISLIGLLSFLALPQNSHLILILEVSSGVAGQIWTLWVSWHSFSKQRRLRKLSTSAAPGHKAALG